MGAEKVSAAVGYGGAGTSLIFGLTAGQWQAIGVIGGLLIALAGFAFNVWLGLDRRKRERESNATR